MLEVLIQTFSPIIGHMIKPLNDLFEVGEIFIFTLQLMKKKYLKRKKLYNFLIACKYCNYFVISK